MKKIGRKRLIAIVVALALLLLSIPIVSYADDSNDPGEPEWGAVDEQGDYAPWLDGISNPSDLTADDSETYDDGSPDSWQDDEEQPVVQDDGSVVLSATLVYDLLEAAHPELYLGVTPQTWFGEPVRAQSGDVIEIEVGDGKLSGEEVRDALDLDYLNFSISYSSGTGFTFREFDGEVLPEDDEEGDQDSDRAPVSGPVSGYSLSDAELKALGEAFNFVIPENAVLSGYDVILFPYMSVAAGQVGTVDPERIKAVISLQSSASWLGAPSTYVNEWYDFESVDGDLVLTFKKLSEPGSGQSMTIKIPTSNGVVPNGEEVTVSVKVYYDSTEIAAFDPSFTVTTNKFGWGKVSNTVDYASGLTLNAVDTINQTAIKYSAGKTVADNYGRAFAGSLVVEDTIQVSEYVRLAKDDLAAIEQSYQSGLALHTDANAAKSLKLEPLSYHDAGNYVKSFRMTYTVTNQSLSGAAPADLADLSLAELRISGMKLDKDAVEAQIPSGETQYTIEDALSSTGATVTVTPCVDVDSANVTGGKQVIAASAGYKMKIIYNKSTAVDPGDPDNPVNSGGINKTVVSIAGASNRTYAYAGDAIVYRIDGFSNALKTRKLEDFRVVDEIDRDDLYPVSLTPGRYNYTGITSSHRFEILIWLQGDTTTASAKIDNLQFNVTNTSKNLADYLPSGRSLSEITKIEFVYGDVPAGFQVYSSASYAPTITMMALAKDKDSTDETLTNTARLRYAATVEGVTTSYPTSAEDGLYVAVSEVPFFQEPEIDKFNKDVIKLRGSEGNAITKGDLLEYTVDIRNSSKQEIQNPFFDDVYVGQTPYLTDTKGTLGAYGEAPFIQVVSVTDINGKDVRSERGIAFDRFYVSTHDGDRDTGNVLDPSMSINTMRVRLKGKLQVGDLVRVSYVMEVTADDGKVENSFNSWAYPVGGGGNAIIQLGKGHLKPDNAERVKPALAQTTTILSANGSANSNANASAKDEIVTVEVEIKNNSPSNADLFTLNSVLHMLYYGGTSFQDVLQWHSDEKPLSATVVHYDHMGGVMSTQNNVAYVPNSGTSWTDYTSTNTNYRRGGFRLSTPIEIQPQESVKLTYQLNVTDWPDTAKNLYQRLYTATTFQEKKADLATNSYISDIKYAQYDGVSTTQSMYYSTASSASGYRDIYFKKSSGVYAGIVPGSNYGTYVLNAATPFTGTTGNAHYFTIYNYSEDQPLSMSHLVIRMPKYLSFAGVTSSTNLATASNIEFETISPAGDDQQVVLLSLKDGSEMTIPAGASRNVYYNTTMSSESNQKAVEEDTPTALNASYRDKAYPIYIGFYSSQTVSATNTNLISKRDNTSGEWGTAQAGNLYGADLNRTFTFRTLYASPGITATPMKINASGSYEPIGSEGVSVGQRIAWQASVRELNSSSGALPKLNKPYLVVKLPVGMSYGGKYAGAQNATEYTVGGQNYVVLPLNDVTTTETKVTVESTGSSLYGDMQAEFYLVARERFYNVYSTGTSNSSYGYRIAPPFSFSELGITDPVYSDYVLNTSAKINVSGLFAFTSSMKVQLNGGATATSNGTDTVQSPRDGKNFTYTMTLKNGGNTLPYENLTLINRMPGKDDRYNTSDAVKGSNLPVAMQTEPVVKLDGVTLGAGAYTISYTSAAYDHEFSSGDYGNGTPSTSWTASRESATAFRVELANPLAPGKTLEVSFQAKADPDTIPYKNAIAVDTFGFGFNAKLTNNDVTWVSSEALPVKVTFPDLQPGVITGTLFEDDNFNGILDGAEVGYTGGAIQLDLINAADVVVGTTNTDPLTGSYRFEIEIPGNYTVRIDALPSGYAVYDSIKTETQGNKFHNDTLRTDPIAVAIEQTVIAHAALVPDVAGELTIAKLVTGDSWVNGTKQPFVFRVDYVPVGSSTPVTFYEVIEGPGSRTVGDLPRGTYTVTELAGWSTGFSPEGGTVVGNLEITYQNSQIAASFTNKREVENYFHDIDTETNKFKR